MDSHDDRIREAARLISARCPRLVKSCYWAGTSVISIEELHHRVSFDLDFHTRSALADTRPLLVEMQRGFPGAFELVESPDEFGSGFSGLLTLDGGERIPIQVLSNYDDVRESDLVPSRLVPAMALARYLADKVQCLVERAEARDLVDVAAVLKSRPDLVPRARRFVAEQDAMLLVERLTAWNDLSIEADLQAYPEVDPALASRTRDMLLEWLREEAES